MAHPPHPSAATLVERTMHEYSVQKPARGTDRVTTDNAAVRENTRDDLEDRMAMMEEILTTLSNRLPSPEQTLEVNRVLGRLKWTPALAWIVSAISIIFSVGVAWAVFMGENATDSEVDSAVQKSVIDHNGGVDPKATDFMTHEPVGHHPDLRRDLEAATKKSTQNETDIEEIKETTCKLDVRSRYQFEFSRWQFKVFEAERKRRRRPGKHPELESLETKLQRGDYRECSR